MSLLVTCDCGKRLQVKDSLAGKRIRCPECQEPLTVPAAEVDESAEEPTPKKKAPVRAAAKVPGKAKRAPEPDDESDDEDEQPRTKAKGKKKGKKAAKASSNLVLLLGVGGCILVLVGGVVAVLLIMNNQPDSKKPGPQVLNKVDGKDQTNPDGKKDAKGNPDGKKDAKGNPDGKKASPTVNPGFEEAAKKVEGAWVMGLPGGISVHYDYRADGSFTLKTQGGDKSVTASGTWKVAVIAKESCQLKRSGGVAAPPYYEPNDMPAIYFINDGTLNHQFGDKVWRCVRPEKSPGDDKSAVAAFKQLGVELVTDNEGFVTEFQGALNRKIKDSDLARLSALPRLETLYLTGTGITDAGLQHLKGMTKLKSLYLAGTKVTDQGMAALEGLTLETLVLFDTGVSDAKVAELQKKFGRLARVVK